MILASVALSDSASAQGKVDDYRPSGVSRRPDAYHGEPAFEVRMPSSAYQGASKEKLADRNFMAWLPVDFGDGTASARWPGCADH